MEKKAKKLVGILFVLCVTVVMLNSFYIKYKNKQFYLRQLDLTMNKNIAVLVDSKEITYRNEVIDGLSKIKWIGLDRSYDYNGECKYITIISKNSGMSLCLLNANYLNRYYVVIQRYYVEDRVWKETQILAGLLTKKHIEKYINPYLEENESIFNPLE